ncbi:uncharacterized protein N7529_010850 [Penicillium soppii]|uniref:uncharacterized protein n=1 Tax=Penicillium soppii TaxID=69789 RepID=UPI002546C7D7|nr:uncharacterized protein N7529_010850 [Penicillium soppii]KAJ5851465.1 hypothetical protein N7529_010850 [Penicillium soppii]
MTPPNQFHEAPGSFSCIDGELFAYFFSHDGQTHLFCAHVSTRGHFECPNAWVKYYDLPEQTPNCDRVMAYAGPDTVTCWWGGGVVSLSGSLSGSTQYETEINGQGHWSEGDGHFNGDNEGA